MGVPFGQPAQCGSGLPAVVTAFVFALVRASVHGHLAKFLEGGGRKIDAWYASLDLVEVDFDDQAAAFSNINTREELNNA